MREPYVTSIFQYLSFSRQTCHDKKYYFYTSFIRHISYRASNFKILLFKILNYTEITTSLQIKS